MGTSIFILMAILLSLETFNIDNYPIVDTLYLEALLEQEYSKDMEILDYVTGDVGNDGTFNIAVVSSYPLKGIAEDEMLSIHLFEEEENRFIDLNSNKFFASSGNVFNSQQNSNNQLTLDLAMENGELIITTTSKDKTKIQQENSYIFTQESSYYNVHLTKIITNSDRVAKVNEEWSQYDMIQGKMTINKKSILQQIDSKQIYEGYFTPQSISLENWEPYMEIEIKPVELSYIESLVQLEILGLPDDVAILDFDIGDIGDDDIRDIAIVAEFEKDDYLSRVLCIFSEDDDFTYRYKNENIILPSNGGGVMGDPYSGIFIEFGELSVSDYGGGYDRWANTYYFSQKDDDIKLAMIESIEFKVDTGIGTTTNYDYVHGKKTVKLFSENVNYTSEILSEGAFNAINIPFESAVAYQQYDLEVLDGVDVETMVKIS